MTGRVTEQSQSGHQLVSMASKTGRTPRFRWQAVRYRRTLAQLTLALTFKECLSDEKNKVNKHRIHFCLHLCISPLKINSNCVFEASAKLMLFIRCTNRDKLQKKNCQTLEKIKTCGREEVLELPAALLTFWVNICEVQSPHGQNHRNNQSFYKKFQNQCLCRKLPCHHGPVLWQVLRHPLLPPSIGMDNSHQNICTASRSAFPGL